MTLLYRRGHGGLQATGRGRGMNPGRLLPGPRGRYCALLQACSLTKPFSRPSGAQREVPPGGGGLNGMFLPWAAGRQEADVSRPLGSPVIYLC